MSEIKTGISTPSITSPAGRPAERQAMEAHLATCAHCQAAVEAVRQVEADQVSQNTRALVGYVADLLVSAVILVAPIANQIAQPPPTSEPQEAAAERRFLNHYESCSRESLPGRADAPIRRAIWAGPDFNHIVLFFPDPMD